MILIDFNAVGVSAITAQFAKSNDFSEGLVRHYILNSLQSYRKKFNAEFGELVLCADGGKLWRKDYFPYYKARRKLNKEESSFDWAKLHIAMNIIAKELQESFPYPFVRVDAAEGDDVIAVLAEYLDGPHMIITRDEDMVQLQRLGCSIYSPLRKEVWPRVPDIETYIREFVIRGDSGDDVPNVLSDDDTFMVKTKKQKPLTEARLSTLLNDLENQNDEVKRNYKRNEVLIDLRHIPEEVKKAVVDSYTPPKPLRRSRLLTFFIEKELAELTNNIQNF